MADIKIHGIQKESHGDGFERVPRPNRHVFAAQRLGAVPAVNSQALSAFARCVVDVKNLGAPRLDASTARGAVQQLS